LETYQGKKGLKRELTLTKAKAKARKKIRINLLIMEIIQEMISVVTQKALVERRVIERMNLKTTPEVLDNYHQAKTNRKK